jgi:hypothetical protein
VNGLLEAERRRMGEITHPVGNITHADHASNYILIFHLLLLLRPTVFLEKVK